MRHSSGLPAAAGRVGHARRPDGTGAAAAAAAMAAGDRAPPVPAAAIGWSEGALSAIH